jgi:hypothetical protein
MSGRDTLELNHTELRKFGLTTGVIVAVLFGLFLPWLLDHRLPIWPWALFAMLGLAALAAPAVLRPIHRGWMKFGAVLGAINTRIILGVFFFLILFPVGFARRLWGSDPMRRKFEDDVTYRIPSVKQPPKHLERPF